MKKLDTNINMNKKKNVPTTMFISDLSIIAVKAVYPNNIDTTAQSNPKITGGRSINIFNRFFRPEVSECWISGESLND
jgi:hypothetical protein